MMYKFYLKLPICLQNLSLSCFGYLNDFRRYGSKYNEIEKKVFERASLKDEEIKHFQKERLSSFFQHALNSSYWKKKFEIYEVDVIGDPFQEIKKLPILTKQEVKENWSTIKIDNVKDRIYKGHTSGTTGSGLTLYETRSSEAERWATWWRYRNHHGITKNTWCGLFGGRSIISPNSSSNIYHRINYSSKQILFSCYHLSINTVSKYVQILEAKKLTWLHGYPSFLAELASLAISKGVSLNYQPRYITLGAENLSIHQERLIENFFGLKPIQHYGLAESTANFSQLSKSSDLIVDEDFSYVEFIDNGENYKIIGTNFSNLAFPLFRYDSGDLASGVDESTFPRRLISVDGRAEDVITLPNGARIGRLDHIFKDALFVDEAQIYQSDLYNLEIRIVKNQLWKNESEITLENAFRERLGSSISINFKFVNKIQRTKSGKLRFVISEVK